MPLPGKHFPIQYLAVEPKREGTVLSRGIECEYLQDNSFNPETPLSIFQRSCDWWQSFLTHFCRLLVIPKTNDLWGYIPIRR